MAMEAGIKGLSTTHQNFSDVVRRVVLPATDGRLLELPGELRGGEREALFVAYPGTQVSLAKKSSRRYYEQFPQHRTRHSADCTMWCIGCRRSGELSCQSVRTSRTIAVAIRSTASVCGCGHALAAQFCRRVVVRAGQNSAFRDLGCYRRVLVSGTGR